MIRRQLILCAALAVWAEVSHAQAPASTEATAQAKVNLPVDAFAGSVLESYLRYVNTLDAPRVYPAGIRGYSFDELARMTPKSGGDWSAALGSASRRKGSVEWGTVAPTITANFNTAFPFGGNDGPVWKGRGLTTSAQAGVWARWKAVSAVFAPMAFRAENWQFRLMPNGHPEVSVYSDGSFPTTIDHPQRFGGSSYSRVDPGESTLRIDSHGIALGASTASQWWGPTSEFPIVLGNNAGGFPHIFAGTSTPASLKIAKVHGRLVYGYLDQSDYSPVKGSSEFRSFAETGTRRFMAGIVGLVQLSKFSGIELGGTRFFHAANTGGISKHNFLLPFQGLLKNSITPEKDSAFGGNQAVKENQLASVFARFAPPRTGFELYVEFGREDHSADSRDLFIEPDHSSLTNIGFRQAWRRSDALTAVRAEVLTYEVSGVRTRVEGEGGAYTHSILRQGHTQLGQLLAADVGPGAGNAQIITLEQFAPRGRWSAYFRRAVAHETTQVYTTGGPIPRAIDVLNTLGGEVARVRGPLEIIVSGSLTLDLNRDLIEDRTNLGFGISARHAW